MGKLLDFIKKTMAENQKSYENIEKDNLDELIDELQVSLTSDGLYNQEPKMPSSEKEKRGKYRQYLLGYNPTTINQKIYDMTDEVEELEAQLESLDAELEDKKAAIESIETMCIDRINAVAKKRKHEISIQLKELAERQADIDRKIKNFHVALLETEYRSLDWLKRVDKREDNAFEEIRNNVELFNKHNSTPIDDGFVFEENFAKALKSVGFLDVKVTQKSGDFGADILAEKDGIKYVIQCKHYSSSVGIDAVQQVYAAKMYYSSHVAVVATNSVFSKAAKILANETGVILWDGEKVSEILNRGES